METGLTTQAAFAMIEKTMSQLHPSADANCIFFGGVGKQGVGYVNCNGVTNNTVNIGHVVSGLIAIVESFQAINPELYSLFMESMRTKLVKDDGDMTLRDIFTLGGNDE